jgi:hypothetical protein
MDSITEILRKLKAGEEVDICDIYATVSVDGKQGSEQRLAALIAWVTNSAGSDSADALLADLLALHESVIAHNRVKVETLGLPDVSRQLAAGAATGNIALTAACRRCSIVAIGADIRFAVGSTNAVAATATSHLILQNERLDIHLPTTPYIAAIRNATTSGTLEISELLP